MASQTVLCVPGPWVGVPDFGDHLAARAQTLATQDDRIVDQESGAEYHFEIEGFTRELTEAFRIAGAGKLSDNDLRAISAHTTVAYVFSDSQTMEGARALLDLGCQLLYAGGFAVKVESSGVAHSDARWVELAGSSDLFDLYCAFVTLVRGPEYFYSCGMHSFGLPESSTDLELDANDAAELLNTFNHYCLAENPQLVPGHTFSFAEESPVFRLDRCECDTYPPDDFFHNPYGRWLLAAGQAPAS